MAGLTACGWPAWVIPGPPQIDEAFCKFVSLSDVGMCRLGREVGARIANKYERIRVFRFAGRRRHGAPPL